ncbi:ATP-dependent nuclease [[Actinomadura] parvosata]|uniref:ATP-dependent nuclease n=1 Tax=[Actinomadura] parvosata TaxID=1955412 RepID=UPI00406C778E
MYLAEVRAENFRIYGVAADGPEETGRALSITFDRGLNVLVGENDSGKTAIIDAIRLCLLTTAMDTNRITIDDFHCHDSGRAEAFTITCVLRGLTVQEKAQFVELLTSKDDEQALYVTLRAELIDPLQTNRVAITVRTGEFAEGPHLDGPAREMLKATYLRPLRDAEGELRPGRNSRLSQVLAKYPKMAGQDHNDFDATTDAATTLVGILSRAEHHLGHNAAVVEARDDININYLGKFGIAHDDLRSEIGVSRDASLSRALERLELKFAVSPATAHWTRRGLGYNNALFMSVELLLLGNNHMNSLLLIEEPEAHLHPQLQSRVMELLADKARLPANPVQVILTTHSPNIAAAIPVDKLTLVSGGAAFSLAADQTMLQATDYAFLARFLDVTKANLFFARAVAIVEGDAEALLLPALAIATGRSFNASGVSVVNVGHVGLMRYSRIFQRPDARQLPVRVACIRDRDVLPADVPEDMRTHKKLKQDDTTDPADIAAHVAGLSAHDGGAVRTFVSDQWTFEYDLAAASWPLARIMHQAVLAAKASHRGDWPDQAQLTAIEKQASEEIDTWMAQGRPLSEAAADIYRPLLTNLASKSITAQHAARLLEPTELRDESLPDYLRDAFAYLCPES